jgi:hypothetical protein
VERNAVAEYDGVSVAGQFAGGTGPFAGRHSEKGRPAWASVGGSGASAARPVDDEATRQAAGTPTGWRHAGGRAASVGSGLAAVGLLLWQCVDFLYADIGGPTTVLTATLLGLAAWWALAPANATRPGGSGRPAGGGVRRGPAVRPYEGTTVPPYEGPTVRPYEGPRKGPQEGPRR